MIVTARQLEELHRDGGRNGRITLHAGTRFSPLAREWLRKTKVEIAYSEGVVHSASKIARSRSVAWWSDGDFPLAKSALMSFGDSMNLEAIKPARDVVCAVQRLADQIRSHRAHGGVLMLGSAGAATVHANRIPEIRAVVGTTVDSVDTAMKSIAPNVLILERSDRSVEQVRNVLARFFAGGVA